MREQGTSQALLRGGLSALAAVVLLACGDPSTGPDVVYDLNGTWNGEFTEGGRTTVSVTLEVDEGGGLGGMATIGSDSILGVVGRYAHPVVYLEFGPGREIQLVGEMHQADLIMGFATSQLEGQSSGLLRLRLQ